MLLLKWFTFMKYLLYYHEFVKELCKMRTRRQGFHGKIYKSKIKKGKNYKAGKSIYLILKRVYLKMKLLKERDCRKLINQSSCSEKPRKIKIIVFAP